MIPNIISVFLFQKKPSMEFRRGGNDLVSKPISIPELRVERMSSMIPVSSTAEWPVGLCR